MFEKTSTDLIREIRSKKFQIQTTLAEIQLEIVKAETRGNAIQKCCVLHLLGFDMNWIVFHVIEAMSSSLKKDDKKIGYMAAALCFNQETPVLMLCTNLIKKDLASNITDGAMALHTLAQIANRDLARDLNHDVVTLLNHSNPYMRKRAVITLYKLLLKYPDAISTAFPRLKDRLEDDDVSVVSATVSVICEMAQQNPKVYLPLVPQLFGLLALSHNWTLIKVVKLFGCLSPHEPRLAKKLIKPLREILAKTRAMSLVYEVVHTIITGGMLKSEDEVDAANDDLGIICLEKLLLFLDQADQNLKFLGLDALGKLLKIRPSTGSKHREVILKCLEDGDISIRNRALELVTTLVTEKSLFGIVKKLILHLNSSSTTHFSSQEQAYRSKVVSTILIQCSRDNYVNLSNFEWFVSVLCDLATFGGLNKSIGKQLKDHLIEICVRVPEIRPHAVGLLIPMLNDEKLLATSKAPHNMCDFLYGAAWVCGEYAENDIELVLSSLLSPKILVLSSSIQAVYLFAFLKLSSRFSEAASGIDPLLFDGFINSLDLHLQERASIIKSIWAENKSHSGGENPWNEKVPWMFPNLVTTFAKSFNMVAANAQEKLPIALDLESWIVPLKEDDVKLEESPTRLAAESVESLTIGQQGDEGKQKEESAEAVTAPEPAKSKHPISSRGSSVMSKPSPKKYTVKDTFDGQELVVEDQKDSPSTNKEEKKVRKRRISKSASSKESRFSVPDIGSVSFTLETREAFKVVASFHHDFKDLQATELALKLRISTEPPYPLALTVQSIQLPSDEIVCVSKRSSIDSFFQAKLCFQVRLGSEVVEIDQPVPFVINLIHPNHNRKMTHEKFLQVLLNPPHALNKVIRLTTTQKSVARATAMIASKLFCVYQILEEAGSLFGMTVKKVIFAGLLKLEDGLVIVEIKTEDDQELIKWIEATLANL